VADHPGLGRGYPQRLHGMPVDARTSRLCLLKSAFDP
jgi:hypothetical protein